jgi:ribosomal protein S18 acetylase RimI-like enzyme
MATSPITFATVEDIPQILVLVNNAYRGEEAKKGWTHEADLIEGNLRIDEKQLALMFDNPNAVILKYNQQEPTISGCVYLEKKDNKLYLGMLSVRPEAQAKGIGKILLRAAEEYAIAQQCDRIEMTVISVRHELISWYERNGYLKTGATEPFPDDDRFGTPRHPIQFIVMEKLLV